MKLQNKKTQNINFKTIMKLFFIAQFFENYFYNN